MRQRTISFSVRVPSVLVHKCVLGKLETDREKSGVGQRQREKRMRSASISDVSYLRMVCKISWFFFAKSLSSGSKGRSASGCCLLLTSLLTVMSSCQLYAAGSLNIGVLTNVVLNLIFDATIDVLHLLVSSRDVEDVATSLTSICVACILDRFPFLGCCQYIRSSPYLILGRMVRLQCRRHELSITNTSISYPTR